MVPFSIMPDDSILHASGVGVERARILSQTNRKTMQFKIITDQGAITLRTQIDHEQLKGKPLGEREKLEWADALSRAHEVCKLTGASLRAIGIDDGTNKPGWRTE